MTIRSFLSVAMPALLAVQPLAVAGASAAGADPAAPEVGAKHGEDNAEKKICRMETPTGSIRPVRTCRTKAEIEAAANQAQANKSQMESDRSRQQTISGSRG